MGLTNRRTGKNATKRRTLGLLGQCMLYRKIWWLTSYKRAWLIKLPTEDLSSIRNSIKFQLQLSLIPYRMQAYSRHGNPSRRVKKRSSWLAEPEVRGSIPCLAAIKLSPATKSRYGWNIAKTTSIIKATNQPKSKNATHKYLNGTTVTAKVIIVTTSYFRGTLENVIEEVIIDTGFLLSKYM